MKENKLTYEEALASPCVECKPSICCYFLQVDALTTQKLTDLDKIKFYLNFPNIEICLTEAWEWIVYYNYPCRFYDEKESICRIHDSQQQPGVCIHYNPYNCYYKRMRQTRDSLSQPMIWINRERLDVLASHISFDEHRIISEIPGTRKLYEMMAEIPYRVPDKTEPPDLDKPGGSDEVVIKSHLDFRNPCRDCEAFCCRNLLFPQDKPTTYTSLDFLRYTLSFPGIELVVSDAQWVVTARATCRHCQDNQCAVYETNERPLVCKYYNPLKCVHKNYFGKVEPDEFMRVGYEEFDRLMGTFKFNEEGDIIGSYDMKSLRERWIAPAPASSPSK